MQAAGHGAALPPIPFETFPARHHAEALRLYVQHGVRPGAALTALLYADAQSAYVLGDTGFRACIGEMVTWLHLYLPIGCHGSRAIVDRWIGLLAGHAAELDVPTFCHSQLPTASMLKAA